MTQEYDPTPDLTGAEIAARESAGEDRYERERQLRVDSKACIATCLQGLRNMAAIEQSHGSAAWGKTISMIDDSLKILEDL